MHKYLERELVEPGIGIFRQIANVLGIRLEMVR